MPTITNQIKNILFVLLIIICKIAFSQNKVIDNCNTIPSNLIFENKELLKISINSIKSISRQIINNEVEFYSIDTTSFQTIGFLINIDSLGNILKVYPNDTIEKKEFYSSFKKLNDCIIKLIYNISPVSNIYKINNNQKKYIYWFNLKFLINKTGIYRYSISILE